MTRQIKILSFIVLAINALAMLSPILNSGDSITYAALSQHISMHGNWSDLILDGQDWLDKPHLPFWITALFFKLFGVGTFSYQLPGFLAHIVGGYFTYRIARFFYGKDVAWMSVLVFVSVYHLMDSSIEVKAETYLTAFIMGACYYWLRFDAQSKLKYLLLGAVFSALAVMTKGVFTLITISSGLVCMWLYQKQWHKMWSGKWLLALALALVFVAPEVYALYVQFDSHPAKVVFEQTHVSGIKFFLWDSQFGRFFNTGPIQNHNGHPLYFVLVFLWAYLPWVAVFFAALASGLRNFTKRSTSERAGFVFLNGAFFITFGLFSATSFQLDHYTVILFPFAAILCGRYLSGWIADPATGTGLQWSQRSITALLVVLTLYLNLGVGSYALQALTLAMVIAAAAYLYFTRPSTKLTVVIYPVLAMLAVYVSMVAITAITYLEYDMAYHAAPVVKQHVDLKVYAYQMSLECRELALYTDSECTPAETPLALTTMPTEALVVMRDSDRALLPAAYTRVEQLAVLDVVVHKTGTVNKLLQMARGNYPTERVMVLRVKRDEFGSLG